MLSNTQSLYNSVLDYKTFLFENDFLAVFPEIFLVIATISLLIYGVIYTTSLEKNYPRLLINISWIGLLCLIFTALLMILNPITNSIVFYNTLIVDDFTLFLKVCVIFASFFCILISLDYIRQESINAFEYIILILLSTCGQLFLISSNDFISLYLAIELQSLCFYVLAASRRNSEFSTEAGLKYFLLGAFSSGLLLFGCCLIYGFTGITNFSELALLFTCSTAPGTFRACELGVIFILSGFLFKMTAVPFHMWAPDVYEGAPTSVTAYFAITPKAAILGVFIRIFYESFYGFMFPWQKIIIFCSFASLILGSLAAMSQNKIKRLLAFSSIGHVGFMLIGFSCATLQGLQSLLIYLIIYIVMSVSIFAIILSPVKRDKISSVQRIKYITDLASLGKTNPLLAFTLTVTMFSMAGIPPLAGFYSKSYLFFAAMSSTMYLLAFVGVLTSVISCFYYIRIVKIMYFENIENSSSFARIPKENAIVLGACLFFISFFMLYPEPLYYITHKVALVLCV